MSFITDQETILNITLPFSFALGFLFFLSAFELLYAQKLFAAIVSFILRRLFFSTETKKGSEGAGSAPGGHKKFFSVGALSIAPLRSRIFFKDLRYTDHNTSVTVADGYCCFRYSGKLLADDTWSPLLPKSLDRNLIGVSCRARIRGQWHPAIIRNVVNETRMITVEVGGGGGKSPKAARHRQKNGMTSIPIPFSDPDAGGTVVEVKASDINLPDTRGRFLVHLNGLHLEIHNNQGRYEQVGKAASGDVGREEHTPGSSTVASGAPTNDTNAQHRQKSFLEAVMNFVKSIDFELHSSCVKLGAVTSDRASYNFPYYLFLSFDKGIGSYFHSDAFHAADLYRAVVDTHLFGTRLRFAHFREGSSCGNDGKKSFFSNKNRKNSSARYSDSNWVDKDNAADDTDGFPASSSPKMPRRPTLPPDEIDNKKDEKQVDFDKSAQSQNPTQTTARPKRRLDDIRRWLAFGAKIFVEGDNMDKSTDMQSGAMEESNVRLSDRIRDDSAGYDSGGYDTGDESDGGDDSADSRKMGLRRGRRGTEADINVKEMRDFQNFISRYGTVIGGSGQTKVNSKDKGAKMRIHYYWDVPGMHVPTDSANIAPTGSGFDTFLASEQLPRAGTEISVDLQPDENEIHFGPWANYALRMLKQRLFPPDFQPTPVRRNLRPFVDSRPYGITEILVEFASPCKLVMPFKHKALTPSPPFGIRDSGQDGKIVVVCDEPGAQYVSRYSSFVHNADEGVFSEQYFNMPSCSVSTSSSFGGKLEPVISTRQMSVHIDINAGRYWNMPQEWDIIFRLVDSTVHYAAEMQSFFFDFMYGWSYAAALYSGDLRQLRKFTHPDHQQVGWVPSSQRYEVFFESSAVSQSESNATNGGPNHPALRVFLPANTNNIVADVDVTKNNYIALEAASGMLHCWTPLEVYNLGTENETTISYELLLKNLVLRCVLPQDHPRCSTTNAKWRNLKPSCVSACEQRQQSLILSSIAAFSPQVLSLAMFSFDGSLSSTFSNPHPHYLHPLFNHSSGASPLTNSLCMNFQLEQLSGCLAGEDFKCLHNCWQNLFTSNSCRIPPEDFFLFTGLAASAANGKNLKQEYLQHECRNEPRGNDRELFLQMSLTGINVAIAASDPTRGGIQQAMPVVSSRLDFTYHGSPLFSHITFALAPTVVKFLSGKADGHHDSMHYIALGPSTFNRRSLFTDAPDYATYYSTQTGHLAEVSALVSPQHIASLHCVWNDFQAGYECESQAMLSAIEYARSKQEVRRRLDDAAQFEDEMLAGSPDRDRSYLGGDTYVFKSSADECFGTQEWIPVFPLFSLNTSTIKSFVSHLDAQHEKMNTVAEQGIFSRKFTTGCIRCCLRGASLPRKGYRSADTNYSWMVGCGTELSAQLALTNGVQFASTTLCDGRSNYRQSVIADVVELRLLARKNAAMFLAEAKGKWLEVLKLQTSLRCRKFHAYAGKRHAGLMTGRQKEFFEQENGRHKFVFIDFDAAQQPNTLPLFPPPEVSQAPVTPGLPPWVRLFQRRQESAFLTPTSEDGEGRSSPCSDEGEEKEFETCYSENFSELCDVTDDELNNGLAENEDPMLPGDSSPQSPHSPQASSQEVPSAYEHSPMWNVVGVQPTLESFYSLLRPYEKSGYGRNKNTLLDTLPSFTPIRFESDLLTSPIFTQPETTASGFDARLPSMHFTAVATNKCAAEAKLPESIFYNECKKRSDNGLLWARREALSELDHSKHGADVSHWHVEVPQLKVFACPPGVQGVLRLVDVIETMMRRESAQTTNESVNRPATQRHRGTGLASPSPTESPQFFSSFGRRESSIKKIHSFVLHDVECRWLDQMLGGTYSSSPLSTSNVDMMHVSSGPVGRNKTTPGGVFQTLVIGRTLHGVHVETMSQKRPRSRSVSRTRKSERNRVSASDYTTCSMKLGQLCLLTQPVWEALMRSSTKKPNSVVDDSIHIHPDHLSLLDATVSGVSLRWKAAREPKMLVSRRVNASFEYDSMTVHCITDVIPVILNSRSSIMATMLQCFDGTVPNDALAKDRMALSHQNPVPSPPPSPQPHGESGEMGVQEDSTDGEDENDMRSRRRDAVAAGVKRTQGNRGNANFYQITNIECVLTFKDTNIQWYETLVCESPDFPVITDVDRPNNLALERVILSCKYTGPSASRNSILKVIDSNASADTRLQVVCSSGAVSARCWPSLLRVVSTAQGAVFSHAAEVTVHSNRWKGVVGPAVVGRSANTILSPFFPGVNNKMSENKRSEEKLLPSIQHVTVSAVIGSINLCLLHTKNNFLVLGTQQLGFSYLQHPLIAPPDEVKEVTPESPVGDVSERIQEKLRQHSMRAQQNVRLAKALKDESLFSDRIKATLLKKAHSAHEKMTFAKAVRLPPKALLGKHMGVFLDNIAIEYAADVAVPTSSSRRQHDAEATTSSPHLPRSTTEDSTVVSVTAERIANSWMSMSSSNADSAIESQNLHTHVSHVVAKFPFRPNAVEVLQPLMRDWFRSWQDQWFQMPQREVSKKPPSERALSGTMSTAIDIQTIEVVIGLPKFMRVQLIFPRMSIWGDQCRIQQRQTWRAHVSKFYLSSKTDDSEQALPFPQIFLLANFDHEHSHYSVMIDHFEAIINSNFFTHVVLTYEKVIAEILPLLSGALLADTNSEGDEGRDSSVLPSPPSKTPEGASPSMRISVVLADAKIVFLSKQTEFVVTWTDARANAASHRGQQLSWAAQCTNIEAGLYDLDDFNRRQRSATDSNQGHRSSVQFSTREKRRINAGYVWGLLSLAFSVSNHYNRDSSSGAQRGAQVQESSSRKKKKKVTLKLDGQEEGVSLNPDTSADIVRVLARVDDPAVVVRAGCHEHLKMLEDEFVLGLQKARKEIAADRENINRRLMKNKHFRSALRRASSIVRQQASQAIETTSSVPLAMVLQLQVSRFMCTVPAGDKTYSALHRVADSHLKCGKTTRHVHSIACLNPSRFVPFCALKLTCDFVSIEYLMEPHRPSRRKTLHGSSGTNITMSSEVMSCVSSANKGQRRRNLFTSNASGSFFPSPQNPSLADSFVGVETVSNGLQYTVRVSLDTVAMYFSDGTKIDVSRGFDLVSLLPSRRIVGGFGLLAEWEPSERGRSRQKAIIEGAELLFRGIKNESSIRVTGQMMLSSPELSFSSRFPVLLNEIASDFDTGGKLECDESRPEQKFSPSTVRPTDSNKKDESTEELPRMLNGNRIRKFVSQWKEHQLELQTITSKKRSVHVEIQAKMLPGYASIHSIIPRASSTRKGNSTRLSQTRLHVGGDLLRSGIITDTVSSASTTLVAKIPVPSINVCLTSRRPICDGGELPTRRIHANIYMSFPVTSGSTSSPTVELSPALVKIAAEHKYWQEITESDRSERAAQIHSLLKGLEEYSQNTKTLRRLHTSYSDALLPIPRCFAAQAFELRAQRTLAQSEVGDEFSATTSDTDGKDVTPDLVTVHLSVSPFVISLLTEPYSRVVANLNVQEDGHIEFFYRSGSEESEDDSEGPGSTCIAQTVVPSRSSYISIKNIRIEVSASRTERALDISVPSFYTLVSTKRKVGSSTEHASNSNSADNSNTMVRSVTVHLGSHGSSSDEKGIEASLWLSYSDKLVACVEVWKRCLSEAKRILPPPPPQVVRRIEENIDESFMAQLNYYTLSVQQTKVNVEVAPGTQYEVIAMDTILNRVHTMTPLQMIRADSWHQSPSPSPSPCRRSFVQSLDSYEAQVGVLRLGATGLICGDILVDKGFLASLQTSAIIPVRKGRALLSKVEAIDALLRGPSESRPLQRLQCKVPKLHMTVKERGLREIARLEVSSFYVIGRNYVPRQGGVARAVFCRAATSKYHVALTPNAVSGVKMAMETTQAIWEEHVELGKKDIDKVLPTSTPTAAAAQTETEQTKPECNDNDCPVPMAMDAEHGLVPLPPAASIELDLRGGSIIMASQLHAFATTGDGVNLVFPETGVSLVVVPRVRTGTSTGTHTPASDHEADASFTSEPRFVRGRQYNLASSGSHNVIRTLFVKVRGWSVIPASAPVGATSYIMQSEDVSTIELQSAQLLHQPTVKYSFEYHQKRPINVTTNTQHIEALRSAIGMFMSSSPSEATGDASVHNTAMRPASPRPSVSSVTPSPQPANTTPPMNVIKLPAELLRNLRFVAVRRARFAPELRVVTGFNTGSSTGGASGNSSGGGNQSRYYSDIVFNVDTLLGWLGIPSRELIPELLFNNIIIPLEVNLIYGIPVDVL